MVEDERVKKPGEVVTSNLFSGHYAFLEKVKL